MMFCHVLQNFQISDVKMSYEGGCLRREDTYLRCHRKGTWIGMMKNYGSNHSNPPGYIYIYMTHSLKLNDSTDVIV